ncbi:sensor histidine kinase [Pseudomonas sp. DC3000-4b1]|uniref:sensor histidine kinase n=1 Tax=unclassified Pseudomonas TaxID=196821 RepID=UPI003CF17B04
MSDSNLRQLSVPDMGEQEFRELADNAPVMIWRSGIDKQCDWFNKPWIEYAGRSMEALLGYGWAEDVHPEDYDRCVATYVTAFDARESFTMPYRLRRRDGVYRWFLDNGAPYFRNGSFAGYFGSCIDITEQRELQEHQQVLLAELNHRVKNNLQLVMAFLQLAGAKAHGQEARDLLETAINRIQGVGLVQDFLHQTTTGEVDLAHYLPSLAQAVLDAGDGGGSSLVTDMQSIWVSFPHASNLGLVLNELITNSLKHGGPAALPIKLVLRREAGGDVVLTVSDAGVGFAEGMFVPGSHRSQGTGIIDALARRLNAMVQRYNDNGAHVRLVFPASL